MTEELAEEIREYVTDNPGMSHQSVAELFNVNHGRISEAIKGKRT
jgi:predicted XRE-type DNA-binding protein